MPKLAKSKSPRLLFQTSFRTKGLGFGMLVSTFLNLKSGLAFGKVGLAFGILHKIHPAGNDHPFPHKFRFTGNERLLTKFARLETLTHVELAQMHMARFALTS